MIYKGYKIEIVDINGYSTTIAIYTKPLRLYGRYARKMITRFVVDTRVNNPIDIAIEFINIYMGAK